MYTSGAYTKSTSVYTQLCTLVAAACVCVCWCTGNTEDEMTMLSKLFHQ